MILRDKIKFILLTIITFGLIWIWINKQNSKTNELSKRTKITININKLIKSIGKDNIISVTNTQNKVKILFKNIKFIDKEEIQNIKGISGTLFSSTSITLIVGNSAETIASALKK